MAELSFCSEHNYIFLFSTFFKSHHSQNRSNEKPGQSLSVFLSAIIFLFLVDQCLYEMTFLFLFSFCFCLQYYLNLYVWFCFLVVSASSTISMFVFVFLLFLLAILVIFCFNFIFASLCFCVSLLFIYFVFGYLLVWNVFDVNSSR